MSRFDYVRYDEVAISKQQDFKKLFEQIEALALSNLEDSRERSLLFSGLEQAYMWTGKAIRDEQIKRAGTETYA